MPYYVGKKWDRTELLSFIGNPNQAAGARSSVLSDGKADGVRAIDVYTGGGLNFTILPGRGMDIPFAFYKGINFSYFSPCGITSPSYYEEPGLGWLRSFFGGLLTTCGITYAGAAGVDENVALGLHGRISNVGAEDVGIIQEWQGYEYLIQIRGKMREATAMGETLSITRTIQTGLGWRGFELHDVIENTGFESQPLMMLYHFNLSFPLLGPNARLIAPIEKTEPMNKEAEKENGIKECLSVSEPKSGFKEKVFFHKLGGSEYATIALINSDIGNGTPMAFSLRFNRNELPCLTEWKMTRQGCYVLGIEPGTVFPLNRGILRQQGKLPFIKSHSSYSITIGVHITDDDEEIRKIENQISSILD